MKRKPLYVYAALIACLAMGTPAQAQTVTKDGIAYRQQASQFVVDYQTQGKDLVIHLTALPYVNTCANLSPLEARMGYDAEFADVIVGDFDIIQSLGTGAKDCSKMNKAATASIHFDLARLKANNTSTIRFWHNRVIDTFALRFDGKAARLDAPFKPKFFTLGKHLDDTSAPVSAAKGAAQTPTNQSVKPAVSGQSGTAMLRLSTGNNDIDLMERAAISKLARDRGLDPVTGNDQFNDKGGQFYQQLGFTPEMPIGAIIHKGERVTVYARRAK